MDASRTKYAAAAAAVALYVLLMAALHRSGWQHVGLAALVWACLSRKEGPQRFVREWWPMILFWLGYDALRLLEPWIMPRVAVESPYRWEKSLFLAPTSQIWPFYFTELAAGHAGSPWVRLLRGCCSFVYVLHIWGVPALMLVLWLRGRRALFLRMLWSFTALHAMTLTVWILFPAAPPWWVFENGFLQPTLEHSFPKSALQGRTLSTLFHVSANRFAAVPSLHGAYPVLLVLVLSMHGARNIYLALAGLYLAGMWFACVFLNQHYIVDLLLGALLVPVALLFARAGGDSESQGSAT